MFNKQDHHKSWIIILLTVLTMIGTGLPSLVRAEDPIKIGILQYVDHDALNAVNQGFVEELQASSLADRIELDVQNANGDQSSLQSLGEKLARDNDILFAIATPAAQTLATLEGDKAIFMAAVTDPVEAGLVDSLDKPGRNVTGTSDMAPLDQQVDLLVNNFPEAQTVGLIYNSSEVNSQVQVDEAKVLLEKAGLKTEVATVTGTNDIAQVLNSLVKKVDAMFMVTDNTIDSAISLVGDTAKEAGIPTIGSSDSVVLKNGLATVSNSYEDYGRQTARMLIRMVEEDLEPANMPVEKGDALRVIVNKDFAEAIGLDPESIH